MTLLVDTSVWVDHLRQSEPKLVLELNAGSVLMHSAIMGELACGSLSSRDVRLKDWNALPAIPELTNSAAIALIKSSGLMSRGIGFIDVHIIGAVLKHHGALLWTRDNRLRLIAVELGISYVE